MANKISNEQNEGSADKNSYSLPLDSIPRQQESASLQTGQMRLFTAGLQSTVNQPAATPPHAQSGLLPRTASSYPPQHGPPTVIPVGDVRTIHRPPNTASQQARADRVAEVGHRWQQQGQYSNQTLQPQFPPRMQIGRTGYHK